MNRFGRIDSHAAALAYLSARLNYERAPAASYDSKSYRLERMARLVERLPVDVFAVPVVHVAGTKGKGSTSAMLASVLTAAGYRTGFYSSPHLYRLEERFAIDGRPSSADELTELTATVAEAAESPDASGDLAQPPLTYFELTTAMAMLHFARRGADIAILEVGLGGRLDSTNICRPLVSVITSVSHDHVRLLGATIAEIAAEKAGIIKPGVPVVSGVETPPARDVVEQTARAAGSRLIQVSADFDYRYTSPRDLERRESSPRLSIRLADLPDAWQEDALTDLELGLLGRHQAANAAVAVATLRELVRCDWAITPAAIRVGLATVRWAARVEVLHRHPTVVVDAAHNVASVAALLATLDESFTTHRRVLIFGTSGDKPAGAMLAGLLPVFDEAIFTQYLDSPRAVPPEQLQRLASGISQKPMHIRPSPAESWRLARQLADDNDLICVTGSCFIAAQARAIVLEALNSPHDSSLRAVAD
jgi:dihydrofolate synthase/folylpolyglutamate synthase